MLNEEDKKEIQTIVRTEIGRILKNILQELNNDLPENLIAQLTPRQLANKIESYVDRTTKE